jgi:hypothetical protein
VGQVNPVNATVGRWSIVGKLAAAAFVGFVGFVSFKRAPDLVRMGILPSEDRSDAFQGPVSFEIAQACLSVGSLIVSLLFILLLSDMLHDRTNTFFAGASPWHQVFRWREVLAAAISAAFAFLFAIAQSKVIVTSGIILTLLLVVAFVGFCVLLIYISNSIDPPGFTPGRKYWSLISASVVIPYALAAMFSVLSPGISAANTPCVGITVDDPLTPPVWSKLTNERRIISGTYTDAWIADRLHVFAIFAPDGEQQDQSWYSGKVERVNDHKWRSPQLHIDPDQEIDFTVVVVDPGSPTETLIKYRDWVAPGPDGELATGEDNMDWVAFPRRLPDSNLPECGHVHAYGTDVGSRKLGTPAATPLVEETT